MIEAFLNNKIPRELRSREDLLTAEIFGLIQYLPAEIIIPRILDEAKNNKGQTAITAIDTKSISKAKYDFWHYFEKYGEPDLVVTLNEDETQKFIIELKYNSSPGENQLLKYYKLLKEKFTIDNPVVILLGITHDKQSIKDICRKDVQERIFTLSWADLKNILSSITFEYPFESMKKRCEKLLEYHGFYEFQGFSKIQETFPTKQFYTVRKATLFRKYREVISVGGFYG